MKATLVGLYLAACAVVVVFTAACSSCSTPKPDPVPYYSEDNPTLFPPSSTTNRTTVTP